jgi:hypothetical protein
MGLATEVTKPVFSAIGVVDDDSSEAELYKYQIEEIGPTPIIFVNPFSSLDDLVGKVIGAKVDAVICDHRLRPRNYANFNGAQAVARLFDSKIPALLISKYTRMDVETEIRPFRAKIPVLLPKDEVGPESLINSLIRCRSELGGAIPQSRRPRRTLVRIDEVSGGLVVAFVPGWNPDEAVRFPVSIIPTEYQSNLKGDDRFFAHVNTDAEKADDLFFQKFEPAPPVGPEDDIF